MIGPSRALEAAVGRLSDLVDGNYGTYRGLARSLLAQAEFVSGRLAPFTRVEPLRVRRLVFVCLGNIDRSAFAAAVARGRGARACSIGLSTTTGVRAWAKAVALAPSFGVSLEDHAATDVRDRVADPGDLLHADPLRGEPAGRRTGRGQ